MKTSKELSTFMRSSDEFLIVVIIIEGPRTKIEFVVSNHKLKEDNFNKPKINH